MKRHACKQLGALGETEDPLTNADESRRPAVPTQFLSHAKTQAPASSPAPSGRGFVGEGGSPCRNAEETSNDWRLSPALDGEDEEQVDSRLHRGGILRRGLPHVWVAAAYLPARLRLALKLKIMRLGKAGPGASIRPCSAGPRYR